MESGAQNLLVVDDDREIRTLLAEHLSREGFKVAVAGEGVEMKKVLDRQPVDLIVLDINMPGQDGLSLVRELRAKGSVTPVIMLTAKGEAIDRILGLEMGADDYLPKPFEPRELLARIKSVLRRAQALPANLEPLSANRATFGGWTVDFERRHLLDPAGRVVMLSGAEFRLLRILVEHAPKVLSRDQLLALGAVKAGEALDRAVDLQISRLRAKFGEDGRLIRTVRSEGYVLAEPVTLS